MLSARDVCRLLSVGPRRHAASIFPCTPQISAADAREGRHGTFQPNAGAAVAPVFSLLYGVHTHKTQDTLPYLHLRTGERREAGIISPLLCGIRFPRATQDPHGAAYES